MKIYWATKLRGFLKHVSDRIDGIEFDQKEQFYEVSSKNTELKNRLVRSSLLDVLGVFQRIKAVGKDCDAYGSFNRFLETDKPYFIYLENPTALYHYALGRLRFPAGKNKFSKCLEDPNLKYLVCMSDACRLTFEKVNMKLPDNIGIKTIYPLVPRNKLVNAELLEKKCFSEKLECLYCVQGKRFYTKGGRDVLEVISKLQNEGLKINLKVITNVSDLKPETMDLINSSSGITLCDFKFSYEEMEKIYADSAVFLQPSSDDSCPLAVLEAVKGGCAVVGSKMYAIPEMVEDGVNGFTLDPLYWTFNSDNMPNSSAWGHQKKMRLSGKKSQKYIDDIEDAIRTLYKDREKLYSFASKSIEIANTKFGEDSICDQWNDVWDSLKG